MPVSYRSIDPSAGEVILVSVSSAKVSKSSITESTYVLICACVANLAPFSDIAPVKIAKLGIGPSGFVIVNCPVVVFATPVISPVIDTKLLPSYILNVFVEPEVS